MATLIGKLFFDYNGNGKQDNNEPSIVDAKVQLRNSIGNVVAEAATDSSGAFKIVDAPVGNYKLIPVADAKFRYMCRSPDEFAGVSDGYMITLSKGTTELNVGLMEGLLTSPFHRNQSRIHPHGLVDLDPRPNYVRDWKGGDGAYDGHKGTDFIAEKGTEILAAAPGQIFFAWNGWPNKPSWGDSNDSWKNGYSVIIHHENNYWSQYNHLDSITVKEVMYGDMKQFVKRGDVIGYCGYTGFLPDLVTPMSPDDTHLHFQIIDTTFDTSGVNSIDPFRDLYFGQYSYSRLSNPVSLWTKDNDLQYAVT